MACFDEAGRVRDGGNVFLTEQCEKLVVLARVGRRCAAGNNCGGGNHCDGGNHAAGVTDDPGKHAGLPFCQSQRLTSLFGFSLGRAWLSGSSLDPAVTEHLRGSWPARDGEVRRACSRRENPGRPLIRRRRTLGEVQEGAQTTALALSDAISPASGATARSISVIVSGCRPAAHSESARCAATMAKWCMVIPRPSCACRIDKPV